MHSVVRGMLVLTSLALFLSSFTPLAAEEIDVRQALSEAAREELPLERRLAAAARALAVEDALDPESALRAAASLFPKADATACWLTLRGTDAGWTPVTLRARVVAAIEAASVAAPADAHKQRARLAACGLLVGRRPVEAAALVTAAWPPADFVRAALRREIGGLRDAEGTPVLEGAAGSVKDTLTATRVVAKMLDQATADEPTAMKQGLDHLAGMGAAAVPLLLHEAALGAKGAPAGRMPRAARAILALGFLGSRSATPVLADCLRSTDGWVRVAAATALGDLGDPAGAVALAVYIRTLGDVFRARDQWEYPGASETNIPESEWNSLEYYNVDVAAADALLRLGVPRAAGYLIHEKLDPSRKFFRIRVLQDAVDVLRRSVPGLPKAQPYNVDAGLPQRTASFLELAKWWHFTEAADDFAAKMLDENDPAFRRAARALAERLRGKDVRQFMITKPACELLGACMTPTLIETLASATRGPARAELAEALSLTLDDRAVPALLGLLKDRRPFVRAAAADALGSFAGWCDGVVPALIALLDDSRAGPRVGALKGLTAAPPSAAVLNAVRQRAATDRAAKREVSASYRTAEKVVLLIQEGEQHWEAVAAGLVDPQRFTREAWWELVRRALDLPKWMHAASAAPDDLLARRLDEQTALAALQRRRSK